MKPPCKDCPRRTVGCHSSCEDYQAYRQQQEAMYAQRAEGMNLGWAREDAVNYTRKHCGKQKRRG